MSGQIEILTIGDELLRGELVDTNSAWLAGRLGELGLSVTRLQSVGDPLDAIVDQLKRIARRCGALMVSGGLGPTDDDRTAAAVAEACGVSLELAPEELERIKRRFERAGLTFTANNEKQAWLPAGARVLKNRSGTAPGFAVELDGCLVCCMPGVPRELKGIFDEQVEPLLSARFSTTPAQLRRLKIFGLAEAQVDHRVGDLLATVAREVDPGKQSSASLHYRATFPEIHVTVVVRSADPALAQRHADVLSADLRRRIGDAHVFAEGDTSFSDAIVAALAERSASVSIAESCTGGLAGELLTRAAGSSAVFKTSVVAYDDRIKTELLGVPREVLDEHGAVSRPCVERMAEGVRRLAGTTHAVAISGIAGPGGGSDDKPVGTVHFAVTGPAGVRHLQRVFPYDRRRTRLLSAYVALWLVQGAVSDNGGAEGDDPLRGRWRPPADEKRGSER